MPKKEFSEKINHDLKKESRQRIYKFVALLLVFWIAFLILDRVFANYSALLCTLTSTILGKTLNLLGIECSFHDKNLEFLGHRMVMLKECTGIYMVYVYLAAIFAYPASIIRKGIGVISGILAIFIFNSLRLVIVSFVIVWHPEVFEFIHGYIWYAISIIFVLLMFKYWIHWIVRV